MLQAKLLSTAMTRKEQEHEYRKACPHQLAMNRKNENQPQPL